MRGTNRGICRHCQWLVLAASSMFASGQLVINGPGSMDADARFENVSVAVTPPTALSDAECGGQFHADSRLIEYHGVQLATLVRLAYSEEVDRSSGPDALWKDRYDIQAKVPPNTTPDAVAAMWRHFLITKCGLASHEVTKERKVYWLVVATKRTNKTIRRTQSKRDLIQITGSPSGISLRMRNFSMDEFALAVGYGINASVINKTALDGFFDIDIDYFPDPYPILGGSGCFVGGVPPPRARSNAAYDPKATIYPPTADALRDQLGLLLQSHVESVTLRVVDRVTRMPTGSSVLGSR